MGASSSKAKQKHVEYDPATGDVVSCLFCNIVAGDDPQSTQMIAQTDDVAAFHPRTPSARHHILVVPKRHVKNLKSLKEGKESLDMLQKMRALGLKLLGEERRREVGAATAAAAAVSAASRGGGGTRKAGDGDVRLVFHVPPFNSVDHLHLHVFEGPFNSRYKNWSYTPGYPWCEGFASVWARMGGGGGTEARERSGRGRCTSNE